MMKALTLPVLVVALFCTSAEALPTYLNTTQSPACSGWAAAHRACTEVTYVGTQNANDTPGQGEHGRISDPYNNVTIYTAAPERVGSPRTPEAIIWFKSVFAQARIQVRFDKLVGLYNEIIPANSYGMLVAPAATAALATFDLTVTPNNRQNYCRLDTCKVPIVLSAAQRAAVASWETSGVHTFGNTQMNVHPVSVDVVVRAWEDDTTSNISKRHLVFHATHMPPTLSAGGCEVAEPNGFGFPAATVLLALVLLAGRRRSVALVFACLVWGGGVAQAASILVVGDQAEAAIHSAAANGTLAATIATMQFQNGMPATLQEGDQVAVATQQSDGSCVVPTIAVAATTDPGPEMLLSPRWALDVNTDCTVSIAYPATDQEDGPLVSPAVTSTALTLSPCDLQNGLCIAQCYRPYKLQVGTYNAATLGLPYGAPWLFSNQTPDGWAQAMTFPATSLAVGGSFTDHGLLNPNDGSGGLSDPEPFTHTVSAFGWLGWTALPGPLGFPPLTPWMNSATPELNYVEAIQYYWMQDTGVTEELCPTAQGFEHQIKLGAWQYPGGRIEEEAAFSGILPNWGANMFSLPIPRLPVAFRILGDVVFNMNGVCPFDIIYPFLVASCGENCYVYTDYLP